jgi:ComF family protein
MWIKKFALNLLFPKLCINCQRENDYLCQDCFSIVADTMYISPSSAAQKFKNLSGLISAAPYQNFIIKRLIAQFKYPPYVKELAKTLTSLIIHHVQLAEGPAGLKEVEVLIPIPLTKKRLKERGFNQSEEIAKELSQFLKIPLLNNVLLKVKETLPQAELSGQERRENIKGVFACQESENLKGKKVLLVDDVFTTGSTMEEAAKALKKAGAKQVWGITVARE